MPLTLKNKIVVISSRLENPKGFPVLGKNDGLASCLVCKKEIKEGEICIILGKGSMFNAFLDSSVHIKCAEIYIKKIRKLKSKAILEVL
jgi:hypothetical protein